MKMRWIAAATVEPPTCCSAAFHVFMCEVKIILPYAEAPEKALKAPISPQIVRLMTMVNRIEFIWMSSRDLWRYRSCRGDKNCTEGVPAVAAVTRPWRLAMKRRLRVEMCLTNVTTTAQSPITIQSQLTATKKSKKWTRMRAHSAQGWRWHWFHVHGRDQVVIFSGSINLITTNFAIE